MPRPPLPRYGPRLDGAHNYDPERRLLAAVVLRAVRDYVGADRVLPQDRAEARRFLWSPEGLRLLKAFVGSEELEGRLREMDID